MDTPPSQIEARLNRVRAEDYTPLRVFYPTKEGEKARQQNLDYPEQTPSVPVSGGHSAAGRTLQELQIKQHGVELLDIHRSAIWVPSHLLDTRVRAGDVLSLKGHCEGLNHAIARLREGARYHASKLNPVKDIFTDSRPLPRRDRPFWPDLLPTGTASLAGNRPEPGA